MEQKYYFRDMSSTKIKILGKKVTCKEAICVALSIVTLCWLSLSCVITIYQCTSISML